MTLFNRTRRCSSLWSSAAVLVAGLLIAGCGGGRSEQYRKQGDTYLELHKYQEAEEAYQNATQTNPENAKARLGLGRCMARTGRAEEALVCFLETIEKTPQFELGYLEAANLRLKLGKSEEALSTAQDLEKVNPELGGVLHASVLFRLGQQAEALTSLETLRDNLPDSALARKYLADALLARGEPSKAETELETALENQQADPTGADVLMVEALYAQGRIDEMIMRLESVQTPSQDQNMVLAYALLRGNRVEEGESLIRSALQQNPSSGWACFVLASHLSGKGQGNEAAGLLQTAADALPWEPLVMRGLAPVQESVAASPPEEDWQSLWRQAALRRLLEERDRFSAEPGDNLTETLVLAAFFRGDGRLAEELAKELPADSPLNGYLQALKNKDPKGAVDALVPWNEQEGDHQILAMNAAGYVMALTGARGRAVQVLSVCWKEYPENAVSLFNLARIFRAAGMPKFAAQALRRLTASFPENMDAHILIFQVLREAGMRQEARQAAEGMYSLFPDSREATLATSGIYVDLKQLGPARKIVERYLESHPDDPEILLTQAAILVREGQSKEALEVLANMASPDDMMAQGVTTLTALSHAVALDWQSVVDVAKPSDPQSTMVLATRFVLAAAYAKMGQNDEAAAVLTQTDKEEPFGGSAGAVILHALGHSTVALPDSETALSNALASDVGALVDFASGAAYQLAKLHDEAYMAFKRVDTVLRGDSDQLLHLMFRSLPYVARIKDVGQEAQALAGRHAARPGAWLGCAAVLHGLEDAAGERAALVRAAETGPDDPRVFLRRGDFFARQKDFSAALTEYRRLVQLRPDDPVGNNNLAYHLLLTDGDLTEALSAAQLAAEGLPYEPHVLHTLGVAQLRTGDLEKSKVNLESALERLPGDPSLLLDYGLLLIEEEKPEEGRRLIESALNSTRVLGLDFDRKKEAEDILKDMPPAEPAP